MDTRKDWEMGNEVRREEISDEGGEEAVRVVGQTTKCWFCFLFLFCFFFQAEGGIRVFCLSRGLGDVYKKQQTYLGAHRVFRSAARACFWVCRLYTSDAADDLLRVDLGGRRIIKKKKKKHTFA